MNDVVLRVGQVPHSKLQVAPALTTTSPSIVASAMKQLAFGGTTTLSWTGPVNSPVHPTDARAAGTPTGHPGAAGEDVTGAHSRVFARS